MDSDKEQATLADEPSSSTGTQGQGRGQRGRGRSGASSKKQRTSSRNPKVVSRFKFDDKWSLKEKNRLLEALRRYDPHNLSNIAKIVGTKSEEEVEKKIQTLRGIDSARGRSERVDAVPGQQIAPIEAWIDLVQEMTCYEPADYSQFISKILGLITRNETFEESSFPRLKWRNIYQFLTDLLDNRVEMPPLTDMGQYWCEMW